MIESTFNHFFRSEFEAGFQLVATKSIKLCLDYFEKIEINQKISKSNLNRLKMIEKKILIDFFGYILTFLIF